MRRVFAAAVSRLNSLLSSSGLVRALVFWQHRHLPLPFALFDRLFRRRRIAELFRWYGRLVWLSAYDRRQDELGYWLSKEAVYWHLWGQLRGRPETLKKIIAHDAVREVLGDPDLVAIDFGCGLLKEPFYLRKKNLLNGAKVIGIEPNGFLCDYVRQRGLPAGWEIVESNAADYVETAPRIDVAMAFNGVFQYLGESELDALFGKLKQLGCRLLIVTHEGTRGEERQRRLGETDYNFAARLGRSSFDQARFLDDEREDGTLEYFVMLASPAVSDAMQ